MERKRRENNCSARWFTCVIRGQIPSPSPVTTVKEKSENKKIKAKNDDKDKPIIIAKDFNIPKTRE